MLKKSGLFAKEFCFSAAPVLPSRPSDKHRSTLTERGTHVVYGVRIFRTGSFKDSQGRRKEWTPTDLDDIVKNFEFLHSNGILVDVPVRVDHSRSADKIVGYFVRLYRDPLDSRFLACDIEFTESNAFEKWQKGTFRSRSSEIGQYETNDGEIHGPTMLGLAFVDIGAVEGIYNKEPSQSSFFSFEDTTKENEMTLEEWLKSGKSAESWVQAVQYAAYEDSIKNLLTDPEVVKGIQTASTAPAAPVAPAAPAAPQGVLVHGAQLTLPGFQSAPATHNFTINGDEVSDFAAVQKHIDMLETFRKETTEGGRKEYVKKLVESNKLPKTQEESTLAFTATLSDDQFVAWQVTMDAAPSHSLFNSYDNSGNSTTGDQTQSGFFQNSQGETLDAVDAAEEIVANHRRAGKSQDFIKETPSYQILVKHNKNPF